MSVEIMKLLPIGTVVRLRAYTHEYMIFGVCQDDTSSQRYDYIGVPWPEGNTGEEEQLLFDQGEIESVLFYGLDDETRQRFLARLSDFYAAEETI